MVNLLFVEKSTNCDSTHRCLREGLSCDFFFGLSFAYESICNSNMAGECTNENAWPENQKDGEK